jgi:hypothetical protein
MSLPGNYGDNHVSFLAGQASRHPLGIFAMLHYTTQIYSLLPTLYNAAYYTASFGVSKLAGRYAPDNGILPNSMLGSSVSNSSDTQSGAGIKRGRANAVVEKPPKKRLKGVRRKRAFLKIQKIRPKGRRKKRKYL